MITSVRFCLSYDRLNATLRPSKFVISVKNCIVVTDVVVMLVAHAESVMYGVVITLYITWLAEK